MIKFTEKQLDFLLQVLLLRLTFIILRLHLDLILTASFQQLSIEVHHLRLGDPIIHPQLQRADDAFL